METNYRGAGLKVLNEHAVAECRVYPGSLETCLGPLTGQSVPILLSALLDVQIRSQCSARCDPARPICAAISQAVFQRRRYRGVNESTAHRGLSCRLVLQELPRNSAGPCTEGTMNNLA